MNFEDELNQNAERYRSQGYAVVVHPSTADLPDFAKDFVVEIVAKRSGGSVLASVKEDRTALANNLLEESQALRRTA